MQIRLAIGEQDTRYLDNLVLFLEKNHIDKLEILSFSEPGLLQSYLQNHTVDVVLLDEDFGIEAELFGGCTKAAYLCNSVSETEKNGVRMIAKFKKPDLIFKDILDLYAEGGKRQIFHSDSAHTGKIILVTGCSGGTGASTFAAALARKYASRGKKTLYLNLETTGSSSDFFSGSGNYRFEDIIFALKSKRTDVLLKMESSVRTDKSGVYFFEPCSISMYMLELTSEDILKIFDVLGTGGSYDYIVVDMNFQLSMEFVEIMARMDQVILVEDGGETSNSKFQRTMQALQVMEENSKLNITGSMLLMYNRFSSSKSSSEIPGLRIPVLGKIPPVNHALVHEIIDYILSLDRIFETL